MAEGLLNFTRLDDPEEVVCTTQGRPMCPDDEVRLVNEFDQDVAGDEPGSLLTRGPYTPRGYYKAAEQNGRAFTEDGWYRSGDICRRTREGNLIVEGRDKDMINRGGEKISAEEVENLVYQLPGVSQVAAVSMPDPLLGERVCLYVVPRAGARLTLEEIRASMEGFGIARFKLPEHLVLVDELVATKVGKIDKKALRADIADRLKTNAGATP
jgi:2,3-dihydroxybenzoate-AMP ligase